MPFESNADAISSIKGLKKYPDSQVTAFRKAYNAAYKGCKGKGDSNCESYAARVGWSAAKKSKNEGLGPLVAVYRTDFEEGDPIGKYHIDPEFQEKHTAFLEESTMTGHAKKLTVFFYDSEKKPAVFSGDSLSWSICQETYNLYIYDGVLPVGLFKSYSGLKLEY